MENMILNFATKLKPLKPVNDELTLCRCFVMALGENCHKTAFAEEDVKRAIPSIYNIPVVGHIYPDKDGDLRMGSHDRVLTVDEDGQYGFKMITVPYGTVPYQDNITFEDVEEDDGTKRRYLACDVLLWTGRYPELLETKYSDDVWFNHSMEIKVSNSEKRDDGYLQVKDFTFSALCLLNKSDDPRANVNPTFPSARVEPYEFSSEAWNCLFDEFQTVLTNLYSATNNSEKGGTNQMDNEIATVLNENVTTENFAAADDNDTGKPVDGVEPAVADAPVVVEYASDEPVVADNGEAGEPAANEDYAMLNNDKREKLYALCGKMRKTVEGATYMYWLLDYDDNYVYVVEEEYTCCGDRLTKRLRYKYAEENNEIVIRDDAPEEVFVRFLTAAEVADVDAMHANYGELVTFKKNRLEDDRRKAMADVLSDFTDIADIDEYKVAVSDAMSFASPEQFREKLYAIRGKYATATPNAKRVDAIKIPIFSDSDNSMNYEREFFNKYLPTK